MKINNETKREEPVLTEEDLEDLPAWIPLLFPPVVAFVPQIVMLVLRLTNTIDWQWWKVFLPAISATAAVFFFLVVLVLKGLAEKLKRKVNKKYGKK